MRAQRIEIDICYLSVDFRNHRAASAARERGMILLYSFQIII